MSSERIYIVGFMGSGKTTAGKRLSKILGWQFTDLDKEIEKRTGMPIPRIFSDLGEDEFRRKETECLRETILLKHMVISTGGGAPCHDGNMEFMLTSGITVYLKLTPEQLRSRLIVSETERPLIKGLGEEDLLDFIKERLTKRELFYKRSGIIMEGSELDIAGLESQVRKLIAQS
jgi:shikimate kinase